MIKKILRRRQGNTPAPAPSVTFPENVPDDFFFTTPALAQRLDLLHHLIQSGDFFLLLVGEHGAGKSALLEQLLASADPRWEICTIFSADLSPEDPLQPAPTPLLERLLEEYDLNHSGQDPDAMKESLFEHVGALTNSAGIPVIIIDGVLVPSLDDLKLLGGLSSTEKELGARIIFMCQPESVRRIRELMANSENGDITHTVDVPPFTEDQVGDYLNLRWNQTNLVGDTPFTDAVIHSIYHASKGLPANINKLAEQFLQNRRPVQNRRGRAAGRIRQTPAGFILETVMQKKGLVALIAGLTALSIGLLAVLGHEPRKRPEMVTLPAPIPPANTGLIDGGFPSAGNTGMPRPPQTSITFERTGERRAIMPGVSQDKGFRSTIAPRSVIIPGPAVAAGPGENAATPSLPFGNTLGKAVADPGRPPYAPATPMTATPAARPTAPVHSIPLLMGDPDTLGSQPPDATRARVPISVKPASARRDAAPPERPKAVHVHGETPQEGLPKGAAVRTGAWLRRQNPGHYTLQLVGLSTKERMDAFLKENQLGPRAAWFKTANKDKDWFVVVYGVYPTRVAALDAIGTLSPSLQKNKPWPVNIGDTLKKCCPR